MAIKTEILVFSLWLPGYELLWSSPLAETKERQLRKELTMATSMLGDALRDVRGPLTDFHQKIAVPNSQG